MFKLEEGWMTVALLCAMIMVSAGGVAAAAWAEGLWAAWITGVIGVFAGLALARSRFSGPTATLFALVYGLFCVGFFICLNLEGNWHARSLELVIRLNNFLYKAIHGGTSRDALPFPVTISLLFWAIGVASAWSVFRRGSVMMAVIPAGVGLLTNAYYYLGPSRLDLYLAVYVLLALMFVARMNLLTREREWQSARVAYSADLRLDFLRAGLIAALAGVLIGWAGPSLAASPRAASTWRQVTGSFSIVRESWMRLFAAIRGYGQAYSDFYGDMLILGGPARLDADPIMDVVVNAVGGEDETGGASLNPILRYYWRAAAYGVYADGRWSVGEVEYREFQPGKNIVRLPPYRQRREASLTFITHVAASSRLYVAPQPKWLDRPVTFELTFDPEDTTDISAVRAQQILRRGETYGLIASMSVADATSLRLAGDEYPQWVLDNFLALPPDVTERTRALARQIVDEAGAVTPYDQVEAVTAWLRQNITYDQFIDAAPPESDPVDYLLFVSKRGYCNYYASAEVVLLRSLGIPARMAAGFAQGKFDADANTYHVLEENAHAWPEVFFPSYGWIEFEPTASELPLIRLEQVPASAGDSTSGENDFESGGSTRDENLPPEELLDGAGGAGLERLNLLQRIPWTVVLLSAAGSLLSVVVIGLVFLQAGLIGWENLGRAGRWVLHWRGQPLPSAVEAVYLHLERVALWLGLRFPPAVTPHERAVALGEALPEVRPAVEAITEQYVAEKYSPRPADAGLAQSTWRAVRLKVWHDVVRVFLLSRLEEDEAPPGTASPTLRR